MLRNVVTLIMLLLLTACVGEPNQAGPEGGKGQVTIRVTIPKEPYTKVSFTPAMYSIYTSWQEGDKISVSSDGKSEVFTLSKLISAQEAEFTGAAVTGKTFDIRYPSEPDTSTPKQMENGSADHLRYNAVLEGVNSIKDIAFSASWAAEHGGTFRQGEVIKVKAILPQGTSAIRKLSIGIKDNIYSLPLADVDISKWSQTLTAYMTLPAEDLPLPVDAEALITVEDASDIIYTKMVSVSQLNGFGADATAIRGFTIRSFDSGDGSKENPYLIGNARDLNNMHNNGIFKNEAIVYFRLTADIDASEINNWVPLNNVAPFDKGMDFDGASHTIRGLKSSSVAYASFAGVLYGNIHDVTFSDATISATSKCGVVAGFLGTTSNDYARVATCDNVTVTGCTVSSSQPAGGFAGHVRGKGGVTNCKVINTTVSGESHLGGFVGVADITGVDKYEIPAIFTGCEVDDVTLNQNGSGTSIHTGGFIGYTYQAHSFVDCNVKGSSVNANNGNVGGFVGHTDYAGANFQNCVVDKTSSVTGNGANVGGFVGWANVPDAYKTCSSAATVTNKAGFTGGFAGYAAGASSYKGCKASGEVSGKQFTGGFAGVADNAVIAYCSYTDGTVLGSPAGVGGFCGYAGNAFLMHCYTTGRVKASCCAQSGGFAGIAGATGMQYCYSSGDIESGSATGAFVGECEGEASISRCIGWNASLPFCSSNNGGAIIDNVYGGNQGSVSTQASALSWPTTVWNLDAALPVLKDVPQRIPAIFVGDSITWQWARNENTYDKENYPLKIPFNPDYMVDNGSTITVRFHPGFFSSNGYIDKGISGQNTTQMNERFQRDVIALEPQVVVIMAGTNDLAQGVTEEGIAANIGRMAAAATEAGIKVVLCSVTPNDDTYSRLSNPKTKGAHIVKLNGLIENLCQSGSYTYCDYWSSLVTDAETDLSMKTEYRLYDNLHPGPDGYTVMEGIIKPILDKLN